ncbi:hypothetical protein HNQ69_001073 [Bartonella callosciuri]|uniref:Uncharacterized protein n=1 Tax=Bartonella callosciuri TaxID=686223 RepID=A0A840NQ16_9HYPH|nr:hypothetical protein [Bartonella callosciuri]MBB5073940.1 hypothetical protein [Bartonella callosciuri]
MGMVSVHLLDTTFGVPDGTAIYATRFNGHGVKVTLELSKTKISGDLLLEAEKTLL